MHGSEYAQYRGDLSKFDSDQSNLQINNGFGVIEDQDDGVIDGVATFSVTCNAAGTGWESNGVTVTQLECSSIPRRLIGNS